MLVMRVPLLLYSVKLRIVFFVFFLSLQWDLGCVSLPTVFTERAWVLNTHANSQGYLLDEPSLQRLTHALSPMMSG